MEKTAVIKWHIVKRDVVKWRIREIELEAEQIKAYIAG